MTTTTTSATTTTNFRAAPTKLGSVINRIAKASAFASQPEHAKQRVLDGIDRCVLGSISIEPLQRKEVKVSFLNAYNQELRGAIAVRKEADKKKRQARNRGMHGKF